MKNKVLVFSLISVSYLFMSCSSKDNSTYDIPAGMYMLNPNCIPYDSTNERQPMDSIEQQRIVEEILKEVKSKK